MPIVGYISWNITLNIPMKYTIYISSTAMLAGKLVAPWFLISCWIWISIAPNHFLRTSGSYQSTPQRLKKTVPRWLVDDVFPTDVSGVKLFSIYLWLWGGPNNIYIYNIYIYIPVRYSHNIKIIYRINITSTNPIISHFIILYHIKLYGYYPIIIPYIYVHIYKYNHIYILIYIFIYPIHYVLTNSKHWSLLVG